MRSLRTIVLVAGSVANACAQTTDFVAAPAKPSTIKPSLILSDSGGAGVLVPSAPGSSVALHGGFFEGGNIGAQGAWYGAVNNSNEAPGYRGNNPGQIEWRLFCRGPADCGYTSFMRRGTPEDPSGITYPSGVLAGDQIGKFSAFGYATTGFAQNESAGIWIFADQNFSNTGGSGPVAGNTAAGANIVYQTAPDGTNRTQIVGVDDQSGARLIGDAQIAGNNVPCSSPGCAQGWLGIVNGRVPTSWSNGALLSAKEGTLTVTNSRAMPLPVQGTQWIKWDGTKATVLGSSAGVTVARAPGAAPGDYIITFGMPFSGADSYAVACHGEAFSYSYAQGTRSAYRVQARTVDGSHADYAVNYCTFTGS